MNSKPARLLRALSRPGLRSADMGLHELVLFPPAQQGAEQSREDPRNKTSTQDGGIGAAHWRGEEETLIPKQDESGWRAEGHGSTEQEGTAASAHSILKGHGCWGTTAEALGECACLRKVRRRQPARSNTQHCTLALAVCCICVGLSLAAARKYHEAEQLKACLQEGQQFQLTSWNSSVLEDALPNLMLHAVWSSPQPPRLNLTIITQLSVDRTAQLLNQCTSFRGPVSAAVYLPLVQDASLPQLSLQSLQRLDRAVEKISEVHAQAEANSYCQLDIMLFYEVFGDPVTAQLYPVNALRNFARMQVRTQLIAAVDVDMMISHTFSDALQQPDWVAELTSLAAAKVATVMPALEPIKNGESGRASADRSVTATKADIAVMMKQRELRQFKLRMFPRGHAPTNYSMWATAEQPYTVQYQRMFEPWFISHWDVMPWFDVNFKGYGLNKIVHVASLNYYGFTFQVHPNMWLVHRPHIDTAVRRTVTRQASDVNKLGARLPQHALYSKVTSLFSNAKRAMIQGDYTPRLDPRMVRCMRSLSFVQPLRELHSNPVEPAVFA